ncbi:hypothetical protein Hanom_Chr17g01581121 [Helianthus anomalus]
MKGKPKISYRYLVMMNIWTSKNYREKKLIPHCRLGHAPFILEKLGPYGWEYVKTDRYHKLKNVGRKWRGLRPDARMMLLGEEDEANSGDSVTGESDGEDAEEEAMGANVGTSSGIHDVEDVIGLTFCLREQQKRNRDRNELWHRVHAYNGQKEINDMYLDDKRRRLNGDTSVGEPPLHHSTLLNPEQDAPPEGYLDRMMGVFGDPKPPITEHSLILDQVHVFFCHFLFCNVFIHALRWSGGALNYFYLLSFWCVFVVRNLGGVTIVMCRNGIVHLLCVWVVGGLN